jgi:hypothetical protein
MATLLAGALALVGATAAVPPIQVVGAVRTDGPAALRTGSMIPMPR